jgi:hypothetical protein
LSLYNTYQPMPRTLSDLNSHALNYWPDKLTELALDESVIPKLIETQEKFINLLNVATADPFSWKTVLGNIRELPANLFLKHLCVLSDVGGEKLMRFKRTLPSTFPDNTMTFMWNGNFYTYNFQTLSGKKVWSNTQLKIDGENLNTATALNPMIEDIVNLLLYGGGSTANNLPSEIEEKCMIGSLIGQDEKLDIFVKQRYIWVSRITGGATSNSLGQLAEQFVVNYLKDKLPDWDFSKKRVPGISQNDRTDLSYDIVAVSPTQKICAIEVSFQVTTNSVIERKAGQASNRQRQLHDHHHRIAYIIDGAGNFQRTSAITTILQYSDCTVTLKDSELDKLVIFLQEFEDENA